jgi:hypothetical protein
VTRLEPITSDEVLSAPLRDRVAATLRPVRPLPAPWRRALALAPVGGVLLVALPLAVFHVRTDVDRLSPIVTWGVSALQAAVGLALMGGAFRQVVPGRWFGGLAVGGLLALGVSTTVAVMGLTWRASPVSLPGGVWLGSTAGCLEQSFLDGVPVLAGCLLMAARGLPARPAAVGALAGLGAGVVSDAAWRMVCVVTEPSHVLLGHLGAVLALSVAGAGSMAAWCRLTRRA